MIILFNFRICFTENYPDSLDDARAAAEMQPDYLKAILKGILELKTV